MSSIKGGGKDPVKMQNARINKPWLFIKNRTQKSPRALLNLKMAHMTPEQRLRFKIENGMSLTSSVKRLVKCSIRGCKKYEDRVGGRKFVCYPHRLERRRKAARQWNRLTAIRRAVEDQINFLMPKIIEKCTEEVRKGLDKNQAGE